jgi:hypothetical protein
MNPSRWTRLVACSIAHSTYRVLSQIVSTVKKSVAQTPLAWDRRNSDHDGPVRRGAGPRPARRRMSLTVVSPIQMPRPRSSPWMRTAPQRGFSRPTRMTRAWISASIGGRPTTLCPKVHFLLTSSRCQRDRVSGVTRNPTRRAFPSSPAAADRITLSRRRSFGRLAPLLSTPSWWRSTAFSISRPAIDEPPPISRSNRRHAT